MKKVQVKRRRLSFHNLSITVFGTVLATWLLFVLIQTSTKVSLQVEIQNTNNEIASIGFQNESLRLEIQEMSNYTRVASIAKESGLQNNQTNIIAIDSIDE